MELRIDAPVLSLRRGEVVTMDEAQGTRIAARSGTLWVTEEGYGSDEIVGPGEALVVTHGGRTVVQALNDASVALRPPVAANDESDAAA